MRRSIRSSGEARRVGLVAATVFAAALAVLPASPVRAEEEDGPTRRARKHYERAELEYKLGRFDDAAVEYGKAYEEKRLPAFLFDIAQCHKLLGRHEKAIFFFETYLREDPGVRNRTLVESLITESRKALAAGGGFETAPVVEVASDNAALSAPVPGPVVKRRLIDRWWFWTIVGVVVVGGAAAAVVALSMPPAVTVLPAGSLGTLDGR